MYALKRAIVVKRNMYDSYKIAWMHDQAPNLAQCSPNEKLYTTTFLFLYHGYQLSSSLLTPHHQQPLQPCSSILQKSCFIHQHFMLDWLPHESKIWASNVIQPAYHGHSSSPTTLISPFSMLIFPLAAPLPFSYSVLQPTTTTSLQHYHSIVVTPLIHHCSPPLSKIISDPTQPSLSILKD